jgi:hypothetical protein
MAFVNQQKKAELAPGIKAVLKKFAVRGTIAVRNHSTLVLNITESAIDFFANREEHRGYAQVNVYGMNERYTGVALEFLKEVYAAMSAGNHDRSDMMTDYFDVGWYIDINIGSWAKPYKLTA